MLRPVGSDPRRPRTALAEHAADERNEDDGDDDADDERPDAARDDRGDEHRHDADCDRQQPSHRILAGVKQTSKGTDDGAHDEEPDEVHVRRISAGRTMETSDYDFCRRSTICRRFDSYSSSVRTPASWRSASFWRFSTALVSYSSGPSGAGSRTGTCVWRWSCSSSRRCRSTPKPRSGNFSAPGPVIGRFWTKRRYAITSSTAASHPAGLM